MRADYSFSKGIKKGVVVLVTLALGTFVSQLPEIANTSIADMIANVINNYIPEMTVSGGLYIVWNYIKFNYLSEE